MLLLPNTLIIYYLFPIVSQYWTGFNRGQPVTMALCFLTHMHDTHFYLWHLPQATNRLDEYEINWE